MKKILVTQSSMPDINEYIDEIKSIWETKWLTNMGEKHQRLESELINYLETDHISLFTNGHLALELSLQGLYLQGEVITTPFTFASTTHAIIRNGLTPVFCDIDPITYTMDVNKIEDLITDKTCAILPVHVYGNICDVEAIEKIAKKYKLKVIYDAAHAFGIKYKNIGISNFGDLSMFSFHATKVFNTIEGGAITYRNKELGKKFDELKNFGIKSETEVTGVGSNAKMSEFQAAMGLCNLKHLHIEILKRKSVHDTYKKLLSGIQGITIPFIQKDVQSNYAYYPIIIDEDEFGSNRDEISDYLNKHNISPRKYFFPLTNTFECFGNKYSTHLTPIALHISERVLTLPMYADLSIEDVERISSLIIHCKVGVK